jgi:hypothetical protein
MNKKEKTDNRSLGNIISSIFGKKSDWHELSGYTIGDVHNEKTVHVSEGASVAGDIFAPRVIVNGLVYGFLMCRELIVEPSGQVWGDVLTVSYQVMPKGKINGWISTLDEGTVDLLISGELVPADIVLETPELPDGQKIGDVTAVNLANEEDHYIYRQLRSELAAALLARREIELSFESRLGEALQVSGDQEPQSDISELLSIENIDGNYESGIDRVRKSDALKVRSLENDLRRLREVLARITAVAYQYQLSYLWAIANLQSVRSLVGGLQDKKTVKQSDDYLGSEKSMNDLEVEKWQKVTAELRSQLAQQSSAQTITTKQLEQKTKELNDFKRLARYRIRNLEILLNSNSKLDEA